MKEASDVIACVCDHGIFVPIAAKLAETFKHVFYWSPWEKAYPTARDSAIGEGYPNMTRVQSPWEEKRNCDCYIFPDIGFSGMQKELADQGMPVFGSREADTLETNRGKFLQTIEKLGLPTAKYKRIVGLTELRSYLRGKDDKYIKVSKWRGDFETIHWRDWDHDEVELDALALRLGPLKDMLAAYVCDPIVTEIEDGIDTYCIDGKLPGTCIHGMERKDQAFLCTIAEMEDIAPEVRQATEALAPVIGKMGYRNFFSMEVRVKANKGYPIDPTLRAGSPPSQVMTELYGNLAEIVWAGANGQLVEPEPAGIFGAQVLVRAKPDRKEWVVLEVPESIDQWFKAKNACRINGRYGFIPDDHNELGWICSVGDTMQETVDSLKEHAEELPDGVECDPSSLAHLLEEVHEAEESGMEFSDQPVPEPAAVLNGD